MEITTEEDRIVKLIEYYETRLELLEKDFDNKIAHLQKKFFDNSNHNIEVFSPTEEFIDEKNYTSIVDNVLSVEEILWKEKTCYSVILSLKGSSRIYNVFVIDKKYIPTEGTRITFTYNLEYNKLGNFKIIN